MVKRLDVVKHKNILVIGMGKTGLSVIKKLLDFESSITGIDSNPDLDLKNAFGGCGRTKDLNLEIILDKNILKEEKIIEKAELVITSPGIPGDAPLIKSAEEKGISIWSELELAWRLLDNEEQRRTIAVTGTNGKTTAVTLIGKILNSSGNNCVVCGNVGLPLIDTIDMKEKSGNSQYGLIRVIEVSSFQLERIYQFRPYISVILNITSDHIDRHKSFENYGSLKMKLISNQKTDDWSVINMDDWYIRRKIERISAEGKLRPEFVKFSLKPEENSNLFYENNHIYYRIKKNRGKINIKNTHMKGKHNISNTMASVAPALLMNVDKNSIEKSINSFKPLNHRMEYLGYTGGIRCFNDSKSTNPDATIAAINDFGKEITLIMGGRDKNMDFSDLIDALDEKVKNLILIGEAAHRIYKLIVRRRRDYKIYRCTTLEAAVEKGFEVAGPGEVLILSPACASMDMFKDYKQRGDRFKGLVLSRG